MDQMVAALIIFGLGGLTSLAIAAAAILFWKDLK
jgi:hypothetical protein